MSQPSTIQPRVQTGNFKRLVIEYINNETNLDLLAK